MTDPHTQIDLDLTFKETTHKLYSVIETQQLIVCLCVWSLYCWIPLQKDFLSF